jgi:hypothetical protein
LNFGARIASRIAFRIARHDADFAVVLRSKANRLQLLGELAIEVVAHEAEVVFLLADAARFVHAALLDDSLPQREAEVVRVDLQRRLLVGGEWTHHVGMRLDRRQVQRAAEGTPPRAAAAHASTRPSLRS